MSEFYDLPYTGKQIEDTLTLINKSCKSISKAFKVLPQGDEKLAIINNKIKIGIRNSEMKIVDGSGNTELADQLEELKQLVEKDQNIYYSLVVRAASYHQGTIVAVDVDEREITVTNGPTEGNYIQVNLVKNTDRNSEPKADDPENFNSYNNFIIEGHPELGTVDIGYNTFAMGINSSAINNCSVAMGKNAIALGKFNVAFGENTLAGHRAFVAGGNCEALGQESFAAGLSSKAHGGGSVALGNGCTATGSSSVALGYHNNASADYAIALGYYNKASAEYAIAGGNHTEAKHKGAFTIGCYTRSSADYQTVIGTHNIGHTDALFIVGNGTGSSDRSNALTLTNTGDLTISGGLKLNGGIGIGNKKNSSGYFMGTNCLVNAAIKLPSESNYCSITQDGSVYKHSWNITCGSSIKLSLTPVILVQNGSSAPKACMATLSGSAGSYTLTADLDFDYSTSSDYSLGFTYLSMDASLATTLKFKGSDDTTISAELIAFKQPHHGVAIGHGASAIGHISTAIGYGATSVGSTSIAIGKNTVANGANSVVLGNHSTSTNENEVVIGYQNAFTVNKDGTATVKTGPKKAKDVATMEYVDTEIGKIPTPDLSGYAESGHTHTEYAKLIHNHTEFALTNHKHTDYALTDHTHTAYAAKNHTHTDYSKTSHTHSVATLSERGFVKGSQTMHSLGEQYFSPGTYYHADKYTIKNMDVYKDGLYKFKFTPISGQSKTFTGKLLVCCIDLKGNEITTEVSVTEGIGEWVAECTGKIKNFKVESRTESGILKFYGYLYDTKNKVPGVVKIAGDGSMSVDTVAGASRGVLIASSLKFACSNTGGSTEPIDIADAIGDNSLDHLTWVSGSASVQNASGDYVVLNCKGNDMEVYHTDEDVSFRISGVATSLNYDTDESGMVIFSLTFKIDKTTKTIEPMLPGILVLSGTVKNEDLENIYVQNLRFYF